MSKPTLYGTLYMNSGLVYDNTLQPGDIHIARHIRLQQAGTPPVSSALGANVSSATPSSTGSDTMGSVVVVMAGALAANTRICTLTFAVAFTTTPQVRWTNETSGVGLTIVNPYSSAASGGTSIDLAADQALAAGTYRFGYIVIG